MCSLREERPWKAPRLPPSFDIGSNFPVWISMTDRVPNIRNQRQTTGFGSVWPLLRRSEEFRRLAEISLCKEETTWLMLSPLRFWVEFSSVHIPRQWSTKQSESTPNSRIWEPLAFTDKVRRVSKSCRNHILERGDHMTHVITPSILDGILKCSYLSQMECQTIGINAKQQDLGFSGLSWQDQKSFEELQKYRSAKEGQGGSSAPLLILGRIFNCGYLLTIECQTIGINAKLQHLPASDLSWQYQKSFEELQKCRFRNGGQHGSCEMTF